MSDRLIGMHGGSWVNLLVEAERAAELRASSRTWPSWDLTPRQLCNLELLMNGGFSPLQGFLTPADYDAVCTGMWLAESDPLAHPDHPAPTGGDGRGIGSGDTLALRDPEGVMLAALHVEEVWRPNRPAEAEAVYGTTNREHPSVAHVRDDTHPYMIGGKLEGIQLPAHYDFWAVRLPPAELR